jgi:hypothetical protein
MLHVFFLRIHTTNDKRQSTASCTLSLSIGSPTMFLEIFESSSMA